VTGGNRVGRSRSARCPAILLILSAGAACSERQAPEESQCYYVDEKPNDTWPIGQWCDHEPDEPFSLQEEYCPAGECVDVFMTCDEVPKGEDCQACPAEDLDDKVLVALGARYEQRCPGEPQGLIAFERGCAFERELIPASPDVKHCCYTALVVGECSLMGT
jgi:hypothetical protein